MLTFCQIIALIVICNMLFNKNWHKAYKKRYEMERAAYEKRPAWLQNLIMAVLLIVVFILALSSKSSKSQSQSQSYSHAP